MTIASRSSPIDQLNRDCFCLSLDAQALAQALDAELGQPGLAALMRERCPAMFAAQPVFVAAPQLQRIAQVVRAVESVVAMPAYREQVLASAPAIARQDTGGALGVFFGYDFHLDQGRLGLIEINTNAGGAMLNAVLARAQRGCCAAMDAMVPSRHSVADFEERLVRMFRHEWQLAGQYRTNRPLTSIAIVDQAPEQQYLFPEFLLFQKLFERHALRVVVADPSQLEWRDGELWHTDMAIDLVYNRLTDFYLEKPECAPLRAAYEHQAVVLTPNPQTHALYADKRRLALFSDEAWLEALAVPEAIRRVLLTHVPHTEVVTAADAERLWAARRSLFFKPVAGFGSRAAYRGDKLTQRVWREILDGDYVAQAIVPAGERRIEGGDAERILKFDLRAYAYDGEVQWTAARLYQGQTTNFRTPGGGFAPVYSTAEVSGRGLSHGRDDSEHEYASYVFLLDDSGGAHLVPHALYVALVRHEAVAPTLAGQTLRLADWYVRLRDGEPESVVNETYGVVRVDAQGQIDWTKAPEDAGWPTAAERARMHAALFEPFAALH